MAYKITNLKPSKPQRHPTRRVNDAGDVLALNHSKNRLVYLDFSTTAGGRGRMKIELCQGTSPGDRFRQLCAGGCYRNSPLSKASGERTWRGGDYIANGFVFFLRAESHDGRLQDDETNTMFGTVINGLDIFNNVTLAAPNSRVTITGCGELA